MASYMLFLLAISSDQLDGYLARKLNVASRFGAYFDILTDFLFISSVFVVFVLKQLYPFWVLALIGVMFLQFVVTNILVKQLIYDPVGKYYGSILYGCIGLTVFTANPLVSDLVAIGILGSTVASLFSRFTVFLQGNNPDTFIRRLEHVRSVERSEDSEGV
jgi:phosphatidylglycerophosphate synthase